MILVKLLKDLKSGPEKKALVFMCVRNRKYKKE